ncbi:hypothetical protein [Roseivivax sp. CAU 1761]
MSADPGTGPIRPRPVFLERRSYRQRRLRDALRLLPLVGLLLWSLPLLWGAGEAPPPAGSRALAFVFAVWLGLILAGRWLARRIEPDQPGPAGAGDGSE